MVRPPAEVAEELRPPERPVVRLAQPVVVSFPQSLLLLALVPAVAGLAKFGSLAGLSYRLQSVLVEYLAQFDQLSELVLPPE